MNDEVKLSWERFRANGGKASFEEFARIYLLMPDLGEIERDPDNAPVPRDSSVIRATLQAIIHSGICREKARRYMERLCRA